MSRGYEEDDWLFLPIGPLLLVLMAVGISENKRMDKMDESIDTRLETPVLSHSQQDAELASEEGSCMDYGQLDALYNQVVARWHGRSVCLYGVGDEVFGAYGPKCSENIFQ